VRIRPANPDDAAWLDDCFAVGMGWHKPAGYFERVWEQQAVGALILLLALDADDYLGHCKLVWSPDYSGFRERGIPEIQDLNVIRSQRRQGLASHLLDEAEARIVKRSRFAGLGFGLYADYGAAQRLYIQRGYVPDGHGLHYFDEPLPPGATCTVDDDLVLYLVKQLW